MASRHFTMDELNKAALNHFVYQPVSREMVSFLAEAAYNVITCDSTPVPSSSSSKHQHLLLTPTGSPELRTARDVDDILPTLQEFITELVVSSNVQVLTLMSTLVYLTRLKSKLEPMARGLRDTTYRIFLASLILADKYLNDRPPNIKHWVKYSHINTDMYSFGFNRTEINLMERQLLFLLEWELRITEQDLYRELNSFLEPLRARIAERHPHRMRQLEKKRQQQGMDAVTTRWSGPVLFRGLPRTWWWQISKKTIQRLRLWTEVDMRLCSRRSGGLETALNADEGAKIAAVAVDGLDCLAWRDAASDSRYVLFGSRASMGTNRIFIDPVKP